ncbi:hypothetical protein GOP47_0021982 [Adiantum capillus-veneris]|uniref:LysM domain-containing protein n=1 Tax=Adiantum capillus-veneris TaxID=13818 RepID=A0A9D4U943_ADICA|nr:hypothetical protein GOP47_0021982 [Adiantum capillus-veneris]
MLEPGKDKSAGTQSPDVQFREIDGEFLKQQARIWLEAVLDERFDKGTSLADILVDGEILLRVSTTIRTMLKIHADGEPVSPKSMFPEASFYGKHSGKYLPYSNVDSFLKVCQKVGLTGIDLFSPPDVVEKKDIRRVCLCLRALSKKARARHLEVPEFDYVTHSSVSMPTEFVGGLRDSLRQASANSSPRDKETPDKVGLSPLRIKRPASGLSLSQMDPEVSDELSKEPARSLNFDESYSGDQQQSVIDPNTPPMVEEDSGFSSGSRSLALSDDERGPLESSSFDDAGASLDEARTGAAESSDTLQKDVDTSSKLPSAGRSVDAGGNHKNATKKGAWMLPSLAAALALLGAGLFVKPRDSSIYQVKQGDTLSEISRRVGKSSWQELVLLNPDIKNPDLIHPNDRLRLRSEGNPCMVK